ncbi:hypothetical protein [Paraflavitalea pollutisoli]|uniref:hypothetical protein n=1 Tax=Paraflavitalea pollutisoli TaxID=3034143 RepID=UPI0023EABE0D|nr:hypothetical protein [Paraflavitalea sp. H1-2-19X]
MNETDTIKQLWTLINDILALCANWFEVIGFILMIITTVKVFSVNKRIKNLNSKYLLRDRINDHLKELKSSSGKIAQLLGSFNINLKDLKLEVSSCYVNTVNLKKKSSVSNFPSLNLFIKSAKKVLNAHNDNQSISGWARFLGKRVIRESDIDEFYKQLTALIKEIEHFQKDLKKTIV